MASNYFTLLTKIGQASISNAVALNQKVNLTYVAIGDGNGSPTTPKESQTELVNEVYRAQVNQLTTDPDNPNYLIAEMIVPTNVGGWSVREVGLFDDSENLIAIANFPETYKPKLEEGSGRDLVIRIILQVSNTNAVVLKIDPTIILASQSWVIENFNKKTLFPGGKEQQVLMKLSDTNGDMGWEYLSGVPIGTVEHFAMTTPPPGYLKADGAAVGRATYPELFAVIGTTFGIGDGSTTFNLPDLINRFAQGSATPGQKIEAGLPNVSGNATNIMVGTNYQSSGAFSTAIEGTSPTYGGVTSPTVRFNFSADKSNPIYGASDTVQPPALTLLPCIKAFDAATNEGLIDVTELANEMASKTDAAAAAHAAMPSNQYVNLTLGPNESRYTAPADGYFSYFAIADRDWGDMSFVNASGFSSCIGRAPVTGGIRCSISCKKSDQIIVFFEGNPNVQHFRFYYCEGSKP